MKESVEGLGNSITDGTALKKKKGTRYLDYVAGRAEASRSDKGDKGVPKNERGAQSPRVGKKATWWLKNR